MTASARIGALSDFLELFSDRLASKRVLGIIRGLDLEKEFRRLNKAFRNVYTFLTDAEDEQYEDDAGKIWLDQLRRAVYDAMDLIDEFEAKCRKGSKNFSEFEYRIKGISDKFDELAKERFDLGLVNFAAGSSFHWPEDKVRAECERLKIRLNDLKTVLIDAGGKQFEDDKVTEWLIKLKDAVDDADDLIDDIEYENLQMKAEANSGTNSKQARSVIAYSDYLRVLSEIEKVFRRVNTLQREKFQLGIKRVATGNRSSRLRREITSLGTIESCIFGRDGDKEKITNLLLKDNSSTGNESSIIGIVGSGGVGKTTLAQMVYNDDMVKKYFDLRAWVCVSKFNFKKIAKAILNQVVDCDNSINSRSGHLNELLQAGVKEALTGKKFLLVLDDVWHPEQNDWNLLKEAFGVGAAGSRIVLLARNKEVPSLMEATCVHHLEHFSEADCWALFKKHAFGSKSIDVNPKLAAIGKEIASKCKGLPLAVTMVAGLLRSKPKYEWENVLDSIGGCLPYENGILPVMKLSYDYLPSHLKLCFAYCSIFPKDCAFGERQLVLQWMAQGFLQQPKGNIDMEDLGHQYFQELLSRSFLQPSNTKKSRFRLPELMRDLAQCVAKESLLFGISQNAHHLSSSGNNCDDSKLYQARNQVYSYGRLRALSLGGLHLAELPSSIGKLKHLKYLNLSSTLVESLPESVSALYNLQTLELKNCSLLKKLSEIGNLINLRNLDLTKTNSLEGMPPRLGKLTNLRSLSNFILSKDSGCGIGELKKLNNLKGVLSISGLENLTDALQAKKANLYDKKYLDVLELIWSSSLDGQRDVRVEEEVLKMLCPHVTLKKLTIKCYGGRRFPTWIGDPLWNNLMFLSLEYCESCKVLPPLGNLPSLKDLRIKGMNGVESVGLEFYGEDCSNPFPSLERLRFEDMQNWKDWFPCEIDEQVQVYPRLYELSIVQCPKLFGSLPNHLPCLEKLVLRGCQRLTITFSGIPRLSELKISECHQVVQSSGLAMGSLKSMAFWHILKVTCLSTGLIQGITGLQDLKIFACDELVSLWPKEGGFLQHHTLLRSLEIRNCPRFTSLVAKNGDQKEQRLPSGCRLESLEIIRCEKLNNLQGLHSLTFLRELSILGCPRLVSFPERSLPAQLKQLKIEKCCSLKSIGEAISWHNYSNASLEYLYVSRCDSLESIALVLLLPSLRKLEILRCHRLESLWNGDEAPSSSPLTMGMDESNNGSNSVLEALIVMECPSLMCLLSSTAELPPTLTRLQISSCSKLESIGESWHNLTSVESIEIMKCENLKFLPEGLHNLTRLSVFRISDCPSIVCFPEAGLPAENLRKLEISNCKKLQALPNPMFNFTSLEELIISNCQGITSVPQEDFPTNLTSLVIRDLKISKPMFQWGLERITSLRYLSITGGCPDMVRFPAEEDEKTLPPSLIKLTIRNFPKLENLSSNMFQNLGCLEELCIWDCPRLRPFSEYLLLPKDLKLCIIHCTPPDQEWLKISHIPCVYIDGRFIRDLEEEEDWQDDEW